MEEELDLYDDNKEKTGDTILRKNEKNLPDGKHILIAALIATSNDNKVMMQLTSEDRGGIYSLPSGHVLHGEESWETIIREMFEEQGIIIKKEEISFLGARLANRIAYFDIYHINKYFDICDMKLQQTEVTNVEWLSLDEINELFKQSKVRKSSYEAIINFLSNGI